MSTPKGTPRVREPQSPALRAGYYRRFERAVGEGIEAKERKHGPSTPPLPYADLLARARRLEPDAVAQICDAVQRAIDEPDRKVSAAFGLSAKRIRARDDALRQIARQKWVSGTSLAQLAKEVRRDALRAGMDPPSRRHIERIIDCLGS